MLFSGQDSLARPLTPEVSRFRIPAVLGSGRPLAADRGVLKSLGVLTRLKIPGIGAAQKA
jgi:hypothetical protein